MKKLKEARRRGLALFVVLVMCLSMLQVPVFAAEAEGSSDDTSISDSSDASTDGGSSESSDAETNDDTSSDDADTSDDTSSDDADTSDGDANSDDANTDDADTSDDTNTDADDTTEGEEGDDATAPAEGEEGDDATAPAEGEEGDDATAPAEGEEGDDATTPAEGEEGDDATAPAEGEEGDDATAPAEGEEGDDTTAPAEGEEGDEATAPVEGEEDVTVPAEGDVPPVAEIVPPVAEVVAPAQVAQAPVVAPAAAAQVSVEDEAVQEFLAAVKNLPSEITEENLADAEAQLAECNALLDNLGDEYFALGEVNEALVAMRQVKAAIAEAQKTKRINAFLAAAGAVPTLATDGSNREEYDAAMQLVNKLYNELTAEEQELEAVQLAIAAVYPVKLLDETVEFNLVEYLNSNGGTINCALFTTDGSDLEIKGDATVLDSRKDYKLSLEFSIPNGGFLPGIYHYKLDEAYVVNAQEGQLVLSSTTNVGTWAVKENGELSLTFDANSEQYTNITITAKVFVRVKGGTKNLPFVGNVEVTLEPTAGKTPGLAKSGWKNVDESTGKFNGTIGWTIELTGSDKYPIVNETLVDKFTSPLDSGVQNHKIISEKLWIDVGYGSELLCSKKPGYNHCWSVGKEDPNISVDKETYNGETIYTGWRYTFPETVKCVNCGEEITLKDEYTYTIGYQSMPTDPPATGTETHKNQASIHETTVNAEVTFAYGGAGGDIRKKWDSVAGSNEKKWEITVQLPASAAGQSPSPSYIIQDRAGVVDANDKIVYEGKYNFVSQKILGNNLKVKVTTESGKTYDVAPLENATASDNFIYKLTKSDEDGTLIWLGTGPIGQPHGGTCIPVANNDKSTWFCSCWTLTEPATVTITYTTPADTINDLTSQYGGMNMKMRNLAELYAVYPENNGKWTYLGEGHGDVLLPQVISKELVTAAEPRNDFIARYNITLNEGKEDWGQHKLTVTDEMKGLSYVPGTIEVYADGTKLDNTGYELTVSDKGFDLDIFTPENHTFTIKYGAVVTNPELSFRYSNSATLTLKGERYTTKPTSQYVDDVSGVAERFSVTLNKVDSKDSTKKLEGAVFTLHKADDTRMGNNVTFTTGDDGACFLQTSVSKGITFKEHELYYLQEKVAPEGYTLDNTKHYFYFCEDTNCTVCGSFDGFNATRLAANGGTITVENTAKTGSLTITKKVEGGNATAATKPFSFTVEDENGKVVDSFTLSNNGTHTIDNLKPGKYTITETNANVDGYDLTVTGLDTNVTVEADVPASVVVTNTYTAKTGSLTIEKQVNGGGDAVNGKAFTFTVESKDGSYSKTFTLQNGGKETLYDLAPGDYTITEENADVAGYSWSSSAGNVTVEGGKDIELIVTNTYVKENPKLGHLAITKRVDGNAAEKAAGKFFTFIVTDEEGNSQTVKVEAGKTETLTDLTPGKYTVTEDKTSVDVDGCKWEGAVGEGTVDVVVDTITPVTVTNTYNDNPPPPPPPTPEDPPKTPDNPPDNPPPSGGDDPTPSDDSGDDPTPPPETVDVPDEEVPLVELPDEEVPLSELLDEEVPLVELPDEEVPLSELLDEEVPLVELPDEEVPLSDVPQTGDNSGIWMLLMFLSAVGLAGLSFLEQKKRVTL